MSGVKSTLLPLPKLSAIPYDKSWTYFNLLILRLLFNKEEKMFAFKLPIQDNNDDFFLLYGSTGLEIFTEHELAKKDRLTKKRTSYVRFYAPIFKTQN